MRWGIATRMPLWPHQGESTCTTSFQNCNGYLAVLVATTIQPTASIRSLDHSSGGATWAQRHPNALFAGLDITWWSSVAFHSTQAKPMLGKRQNVGDSTRTWGPESGSPSYHPHDTGVELGSPRYNSTLIFHIGKVESLMASWRVC